MVSNGKSTTLGKKIIVGEKYLCFLGEFETELIWPNILLLIILHVLAVYALVVYNPFVNYPLATFVGSMYGIIGGIGVTAGAHRYWTHKSFKATKSCQILLLAMYLMAGHNPLFYWIRDHRVHHKYSETDADPHNSKRGFFFAHVGWLCMRKHPEVHAKGKLVDMSDINSDPLVSFSTKYWTICYFLFVFIIPIAISKYLAVDASWPNLIFSNILRYTILLNCTWLVNSAAHMWGYRPYNGEIGPVDNKIVSFFTSGEGFHNYHHTFPWDYRTGELGNFFNLTTLLLNWFAKIGLVYDLKSASPNLIENSAKQKGDGSWIKKVQ